MRSLTTKCGCLIHSDADCLDEQRAAISSAVRSLGVLYYPKRHNYRVKNGVSKGFKPNTNLKQLGRFIQEGYELNVWDFKTGDDRTIETLRKIYTAIGFQSEQLRALTEPQLIEIIREAGL